MQTESAVTTDAETAEIIRRVEAFPLDDPASAFPFSLRLAKENAWSLAFTARVCVEYKRFLILARCADHPISPSATVDKAWHLHLLYTRSYWEALCGQVLGRPFHHEPSKGGAEESVKFGDWYAKTLESYRRIFGTAPPADIWPQRNDTSIARVVDPRRHWVIPKLRLFHRRGVSLILLCLGMLPHEADAQVQILDYLNPMDLPGPAFLVLYGCSFVVSVCLCLSRRMLRLRALENGVDSDQPLHPLEMAYLAGGQRRMAQTVLAALVARNALRIAKTFNQWRCFAEEQPATDNEAQLRVWKAAHDSGKEGLAVQDLGRVLRPDMAKIEKRLAERGLSPTTWELGALRRTGMEGFVVLLGMGVWKLFVGIGRGKPVGFLLLSLLGTLVAMWFLRNRTPRITRKGEAFLTQYRNRFSSSKLKQALFLERNDNSPTLDPVLATAIGVALYSSAFAQEIGMPSLSAIEHATSSLPGQGLKAFVNQGGGCVVSTGCDSSCGSDGGGGGGDGGGCGGCGGCGGD